VDRQRKTSHINPLRVAGTTDEHVMEKTEKRLSSMGGQFLSLDAKGRFTWPAVYQRQFDVLGVKWFKLTFGPSKADERYLEVWPDIFWKQHVKELMENLPDSQLPYYMTYYIEPAIKTGADKQGRMIMPSVLRDYMQLDARSGDDEAAEGSMFMVATLTHFRLYRWDYFTRSMGAKASNMLTEEEKAGSDGLYDRTAIIKSVDDEE